MCSFKIEKKNVIYFCLVKIDENLRIYNASQKNKSTLLNTYVSTERIFDSLPFLCNRLRQ